MSQETVKRLTPSKDTLNLLFSRCGNICAFPDCNLPVFNDKNEFITQVCHIESANPGGERFNENSSNEDRRAYDNLIILCYEHHKVTDNVDVYTTEKMREMKALHEHKFQDLRVLPSKNQLDEIYREESSKSLQQIEDHTTAILTNQSQQMDMLKEILSRQVIQVSPTQNLKTDYDRQIDNIIALRSANQQSSAITLFEKMRSDDWPVLSEREKFRTLANLGILHLDIIENNKAADFFIAALNYQPNDPKAINYGVLGFSIKEDFTQAEKWIAKGLALDPLNIGIYSSLVRLRKDLPLAELLALIPEEIRQESEIAFEIALVCKGQKNYDDAITWAQIALDADGTNKYEMRAVLAVTILESIQQPYQITTGQITQETKLKAQYVIDLYTQAWDEVKHSDLRKSRVWYLINRAVARKYLGDYNESYEDIKEACNQTQENFAIRHLAIVSMEIGEKEKALETVRRLKTLTSGQELNELDFFESQILWQKGQDAESVELMEKLLEKDISDVTRKHAREFLIQIYISKNELSKAEALNRVSAEKDSDSITSSIFSGKIELARSRTEEALVYFKGAMSMVKDETSEPDIYDLSRQFEKLKLYPDAIFLREKVTNLNVYSTQTRELLDLYYNSGDHAKLLSTSEHLINLLGPIPYVTELKSFVYERINDFPNAIATCVEHLKIYPDDQHVLIRLALIYSRQDDLDKVRLILKSIEHLDSTLSMSIQFSVAMLCHDVGEQDKFYQFSYETRRRFINDFNAHEQFIHLNTVLNTEREHPINPEIIDVGTAVTVSAGDETISYLIEDRTDLVRSRGEISPDSEEATELIGKKISETVVIGKYGQEFIISEILHRQNAALKESFRLISTTFSGTTSFRKFTVGDTGDITKDFKVLFEGLDQAAKQDEQLENFYKQGKCPLGTIAAIKKTNLIKIWGGYISDKELGLRTTLDREEVMQAFALLDNKIPILLDLTALCTIGQLDCYAEVELLNCERLVSESTLAVIYELSRELQAHKKTGSMGMSKIKGRYIRNINSAETVLAQIHHLKKITNWVKTKCRTLPCNAALQMNALEKEKLNQAVGESVIDSILTANEYNCLLYAEEANVRLMAKQQNACYGLASFMVFLYLSIRKKISKKRFTELNVNLIGLNYTHIPVDPGILLEASRRTKFNLEYPLLVVLDGLNSDMVEDEYTIKVVADYFTGLYKQSVSFIFERDIRQMREDLVIQTLVVLNKKFDLKRSQSSILIALRERMDESDLDFTGIKKIIQQFCETG